MKRKVKLSIILTLSLTIIITALFLLMYLRKSNEENKYIYGGYFLTRIESSDYYSSGFEKEGNDYYRINITNNIEPYNYFYSSYYTESIPSKYILSRDMQYEHPWDTYYMQEYMEYLPSQEVKKFMVEVYDIETNELVDTIDVKEALDKYGEDIYLANSDAYAAAVNDNPAIMVNVYDKAYSVKEFENDDLRKSMIDIDLSTKEHTKEKDTQDKQRLGKRISMAAFERSEKRSVKTDFYVSTERYWDGTVNIRLTDINKINENYTKLYEKFPSLKEDIDTLKKKGKTIELSITLTGNPSYEEVAELITEEGKELSFDDVWVEAKDSVDGVEYKVQNFDEWRKYYKDEEKDISYSSPIFPRESK